MWFVVLAALIGLNEISRRSKAAGLVLFVAAAGRADDLRLAAHRRRRLQSTGTWFHWVKVYSALAGCLGFMAHPLHPAPRARTSTC